MTHQIHDEQPRYQIEPVEDHVAGDSIIFGPYTVEEGSGVRDLSGDTIEWYLFDSKYESDPTNALLDHTHTDVEVGSPPDGALTDGEVQVFVGQGATSEFAGDAWHRLVIDPVNDSKLSFKGRVDITP